MGATRSKASPGHAATAALAALLWAAPTSAWTDVVVDPDAGGSASLVVVGGRPAIAHRTGGVLYARADDARGLAWGSPVVVDAVASGRGADLAIVDGNPAIAYYDDAGTGQLKFVRALDPDGAAWGSPVTVTIAATDFDTASPSLAVVAGNPAIGFVHVRNASYVRALDPDGVAWGSPVVVTSMPGYDSDASLAVVNGRPAVIHTLLGDGMYYVRSDDATGASWPASSCAVSLPFTDAEASLTIVERQPALDAGDVYHALRSLELPPAERPQRGLTRVDARPHPR